MTIDDSLTFSVLSAPLAQLDRRALSQAWYSALYGAAMHEPAPRAASGAVRTGHREARTSAAPTADPRPGHASEAARAACGRSQPEPRGAEKPERRAARSPLARKIERNFLAPRAAAKHASFSLQGSRGRVHVLIRDEGARVRLLAICPPAARAEVARALLQARYALALRGIDLDASARS